MKEIKIEEAALRIGVSCATINRWYKFKKENPKSEFAKSLPDYEMRNDSKSGKIRVWNEDAIYKLLNFKASVKPGRAGKMGKYEGRGTSNGKSKSRKTENTK